MNRTQFELAAPDKAIRFIRGYEKGMYTELEVVSQLVSLAANCAPAELASVIPSHWLTLIQNATRTPPRSCADVVWISGAIYEDGVDAEQVEAELSKTWFDGAWQWHRHFSQQGSQLAETERVHE